MATSNSLRLVIMNNEFNFSADRDQDDWRPCQSGVLRRYSYKKKKEKIDLRRRRTMIQIASGATTMVAGAIGLFWLGRRSIQPSPQAPAQVAKSPTPIPVSGKKKSMLANTERKRREIKRRVTCRTFIASLDAYIKDEIADKPLRKDLSEHLSYCKSCQQKFTRMGGDMSQV